MVYAPGFCHVNFPPSNIDLSLTFHVSCHPFVSDNDQPESGRVFPQEFTGYRVPCQVSLKTEICSMIFSWGVRLRKPAFVEGASGVVFGERSE